MSLKIGVVLQEDNLFAWQYEFITALNESVGYDVKYILVKQRNVAEKGAYNSLVNYLYKKLIDRQAFQKNALQMISHSQLDCNVSRSALTGYIEDDTLVFNDSSEVFDIIISPYLLSVNLDSWHCVNRGFLIFSEADYASSFDSRFIGFWELYRKSKVSTSTVYFLDKSNDSYSLIDSSQSYLHQLSLQDTRSASLWKGAALIERSVKTISKNNLLLKESNAKGATHWKVSPSKPQLMLFLISQMYLKGKTLILNTFYDEKWHVLISNKTKNTELNLHEYKKLESPNGVFWADPFVHEKNGQLNVFVEEYFNHRGRAHISVLSLDESLNVKDSKPIIETEFHQSYPFLFEYDEELYLLPESGESKNISIYKCSDYPYKWSFHKHLMTNIEAYDTTLLEHNNKWWMFVNVVSKDGISDWDELYIFYADDPVNGEWQAHKKNPVVSDVSRARPAGRIFLKDGKLIRPSQDSTMRYGYALNFYEISVLNEDDYTENIIAKVLPEYSRNHIAVHTYNRSENFSVIDGLFRVKK